MPEWMRKSYNYSQNKTDDGTETSGSVSWWNDSPETTVSIGDEFQPIPGGPTLKVSGINIQSQDVQKTLFGQPITLWKIDIQGNTNADPDDTAVQYSFTISRDDKGIRQVSGTMTARNSGAAPVLQLDINDTFAVPGIGTVTCTNVSGGSERKSDGTLRWNTTYSGAIVAASITPPTADPTATSYSFNGEFTRTVAGELVAMQRSSNPIRKKTVTLYNSSESLISTMGATYSWGRVTGEEVSPEIVKQDGITIGTSWRHDISIED
jgi:hypothetical protein